MGLRCLLVASPLAPEVHGGDGDAEKAASWTDRDSQTEREISNCLKDQPRDRKHHERSREEPSPPDQGVFLGWVRRDLAQQSNEQPKLSRGHRWSIAPDRTRLERAFSSLAL